MQLEKKHDDIAKMIQFSFSEGESHRNARQCKSSYPTQLDERPAHIRADKTKMRESIERTTLIGVGYPNAQSE